MNKSSLEPLAIISANEDVIPDLFRIWAYEKPWSVIAGSGFVRA